MSVVDGRETPPEIITDDAWDRYLGAAAGLLVDNGESQAAALLVDARLHQAIDSSDQLERMNFYVDHLLIRSASEPTPPDWRAHMLQRLGSSPVNQATIGPPME